MTDNQIIGTAEATAHSILRLRKALEQRVQIAADIWYQGVALKATGYWQAPEDPVDWTFDCDDDGKPQIRIYWDEFKRGEREQGEECFSLDFVMNKNGTHEAYLAQCRTVDERNKKDKLERSIRAAEQARDAAEQKLKELRGE